MLIEWTEKNSVGVKELDNQHKKIIKIINELYEAMKNDEIDEKIEKIFNELVDYANYHFSTEERYFDLFNYQEKEVHKQQHNDYKKKISSFIKKSSGDKIFLPFELIDFLEDWWIYHINYSDKKYTECFHRHGLY